MFYFLRNTRILYEAEHILLAVLDWGLGHAARCVPLIEEWKAKGQRVTIAAGGNALAFLQAELPDHDQWLALPPYAVKYPSTSMVWNLTIQGPRLLRGMWQSHQRITAYVKAEGVDVICSDGRFACWSKQCQSIWMAHQLQIQHTWKPLQFFLNKVYHAFVRRCYQMVWVPDFAGDNAIAGELSQPISGIKHKYLGPLSRFQKQSKDAPLQYRYMALLSGPEPQRSYLEKELLAWMVAQNGTCLLVRGVPGSESLRAYNEKIMITDWLLKDQLLDAVAVSQSIICRSGYSTLMDAWYWEKTLLLIPTPGQTEQVYLADYWTQKGWAVRFTAK